jgi:hypothetical protein
MAEDPDRLQERSERLEREIADTREEWQRKQADDRVPGAAGEPAEEMPPPEPDETD